MKTSWLSLSSLCGIGLLLPSLVLGSEIEPGFDLFETAYEPPTNQTDISLPGIGSVILINNPEPLASEGLGNTDTIVERKQGIPAGGFPDTIDIELVALSLKSLNPVDLGGGTMADLYVVINALGLPGLPATTLAPSVGTMTVNHENGDGDESQGTFSSNIPQIQVLLIFVQAGGELGNPAHEIARDTYTDPRALTSTGDWAHKKPPTARLRGAGHKYPAGKFYLTSVGHTGPHPSAKILPVIFEQDLIATMLGNSNNVVQLSWITRFEKYMAGFVVYRGELKRGFVECTADVNHYASIEMISWEDSQVGVSIGGASYSVDDPNGQSDFCYGLVSVGFDGTYEIQITSVSP